MAVQFKMVPKKNMQTSPPEVKYYPCAVSQGKVDLDDLARRVAMQSTMSVADCYGVIVGLAKVIAEELTDGNIVAKYHLAGDSVNEGDALFRIQSDGSTAKLSASSSAYRLAIENAKENSPVLQDLQIKIKSAETVFANDQSSYNRMKNMYDAGAVSKTQLDQASTAQEVSRNTLQSAKETYTRTKEQLQVDAQNAQALVAASGQDLSNYVVKALIKSKILHHL